MTTDQSPPVRPKRSWFQFSIKALLGLAVFVALGCAALLNASEWWVSLTFTLALVVLLVAVLASVFRRGSIRAFWIGFAVVGWVYLLLFFWPLHVDPVSGWSRDPQSQLFTTRLSDWAYFRLVPLVRTPPVPPTAPIYPSGPKMDYPAQPYFNVVGHWLWTLVLALLGGLLARYLYATREKE